MTFTDFLSSDEKPLEHYVTNGGFCGIFRTIGCIGDSLSSGEFETRTEDGISGWHDMYEYSWGQYIARSTGSTVYNFSRGGMTAKDFFNSFGEECGAWKNLCQAYIIALGVNDLGQARNAGEELGDTDNLSGWDADTFAHAYGNIIVKLKRLQPKAHFFLMTLPKEENETDEQRRYRERHSEILYEIAEKFVNCHILDFGKYAPVYDADFKSRFYLGGHLNPMGYILTARMVESYIDYIIRHDTKSFSHAGFIGTSLYHCEENK